MVGAVEAFVLFFFFFLISQEEKGCGRGAQWLETLSLSLSLPLPLLSAAQHLFTVRLSLSPSHHVSLPCAPLSLALPYPVITQGREKKNQQKKKQKNRILQKNKFCLNQKKVPARTCRAELLWDRTIFTPRLAFTS